MSCDHRKEVCCPLWPVIACPCTHKLGQRFADIRAIQMAP